MTDLQSAVETLNAAIDDALTRAAREAVQQTMDAAGMSIPFEVTVSLARPGAPLTQQLIGVRQSIGASLVKRPDTPIRPKAPKSKGKSKTKAPRKRPHGRPPGALQLAVIESVETLHPMPVTVATLQEALQAKGIATSNDNLHQTIRRAVMGGKIVRVGRGAYKLP